MVYWSSVFIVNFEKVLKSFSGVPIVNFEQVNINRVLLINFDRPVICWEVTKKYAKKKQLVALIYTMNLTALKAVQ